jgi:hypothetical protein
LTPRQPVEPKSQPADGRLRAGKSAAITEVTILQRPVPVALAGAACLFPPLSCSDTTSRASSILGQLAAASARWRAIADPCKGTAVPDGDGCCQSYADSGQLGAEGLGYLGPGRQAVLSGTRPERSHACREAVARIP